MKARLFVIVTLLCIAINITDTNKADEVQYAELMEVKVENKDEYTSTEVESESIEINKLEQVIEREEAYIFIGDSRVVGMNTYCNIEDEYVHVIASVGQGYDYLINEALPKMETIIANCDNEYNWNIVLCLGINDLNNIDKYIDAYEELKEKYKVIIVSVNPVEYHKFISDNDIKEFNGKLQDIEGVEYIDTYSYLKDIGFSTTDGIHYTKETYHIIYRYLRNSIDKIDIF